MAHQQHGHAATTGVDAYGNPVASGGAPPVAGTTGAPFQPAAAVEQRPRGILHRSSSSSSSSSSEDDGMGGRRKKGIKQKIKEKLPGGRKGGNNQTQPAAATTGAGAYAQPQGAYGQQGHTGNVTTYGQAPVQHGHATDAYGQHGHAAGTYAQPQAGPTAGTYGQQHVTAPVGGGAHGAATGEKKGIMDKIKEKLPGHQ